MKKDDRGPSEEPDYMPPGILIQSPPGRTYGGHRFQLSGMTEADAENNE